MSVPILWTSVFLLVFMATSGVLEQLTAFIYNMYYDPVVKLIYGIWGRYLNPPEATQPPPLDSGINKLLIPPQLVSAETQPVGDKVQQNGG